MKTTNLNRHPMNARQRGFTLMEVLVTMLVLGVGLLGLASLQAQGMKFNHDAHVRSQATTLATAIMDQMRANRANATAYTQNPDPNLNCNPSVAGVAMDLRCWHNSISGDPDTGLENVLPSATGTIAANGTMFDVTIRWVDRETQTQTECAALPAREWDSGAGLCRTTQIWTFMP